MDWKILDSEEQLTALVEASSTQSFAIFKHSTRCSLSNMSKNRIERNWDKLPVAFPIFYLDLLTYRPISDSIARIFDLEHQSPQLLLVENGKCVFHSNHSDINIPELVQRIKLSQN